MFKIFIKEIMLLHVATMFNDVVFVTFYRGIIEKEARTPFIVEIVDLKM